jgi:ribosome biogenesis GTPase
VSAQTEGRVLRSAGGVYSVDCGDRILDCTLRGRLKLDDEQINPGDFVLLEHLSDGSHRIENLLPRSTKLSRRAVAGSREQVIVANVDQLAAVFAAGEPAPDFRLLDRFLVLAELNELSAFIVLNKTDLPSDAGTMDTFDIYREAGYDILPTSAHRGDGIPELSRRLGGHATVFAGPSGVGKSSLLNLLLPEHELKVREVSRKRGRGRHTTVGSTFYRLPDGGYVADTPGLQLLVLWDLSPDELAGGFPEFGTAIGGCRFNDCRHVSEPDCAVRRLIEAGAASEERYGSYRALLDEITQVGS